jgi:hypothetical protein
MQIDAARHRQPEADSGEALLIIRLQLSFFEETVFSRRVRKSACPVKLETYFIGASY